MFLPYFILCIYVIFPIYHGYSVLVQDYYFLVVYCIRTQFYTFLIVHYQLETPFYRYYLAFKRKKIDIHMSFELYIELLKQTYMYIDLKFSIES